jgi:hypothetical protein
MTKRFCLVAVGVLFAWGSLAVVAPMKAQESGEKEASEQGPDQKAAASQTAKEQNSRKNKNESSVNDYPVNFPDAEGPVELRPPRGSRITLKMTDSTRVIYESIGKQAKIDVLFDPDYTPRNISVDLNGVSPKDALRIVAFESRTFWRPVTSDSIFVAADNTGKRRELEQQILKTYYFPNVHTPTDLQDIVNALRTIVEIPRIQQIPSQQAILVRATPEQMALSDRIVDELNLSREQTRGQYRLEYKITETEADGKLTSRTYTLLLEPHQTARLRLGPPVQVLETSEKDEKKKTYVDMGKNIDCQVRLETEHTVSLHLTVDFPDVLEDEHADSASAHGERTTQQIMMETSVTLELGTPTTIGSFQDPVSKRSFQIEATATRTKAKV